MALIAQLSDTHVVATAEPGDAASYFADALRALGELESPPDAIVVTGDLVDAPDPAAYERFAGVMRNAPAPWLAVPGNHDDRVLVQRHLPREAVGAVAADGRATGVLDVAGVRVIALDVARGPQPAGIVDAGALERLATLLDERADTPTLLAMHQPPYAALRIFAPFGFSGARELRTLVAASPQLGRVVCGHVHCVTRRTIGNALAMTAPSTAPQRVPELFEPGLRIRRERSGFATHTYDAERGWASLVYRRDEAGAYARE